MQIKTDIKSFTRQLNIKEKFYDSTSTDNSIVRNKSNKNFKPQNPELTNIINEIESLNPIFHEKSDNLTKQERLALKELKDNPSIVIKKADKGGNLVIMDVDFYRNKLVLEDHLSSSTYRKVENNCDEKVMNQLNRHVQTYKECLTTKEQDYLTNFKWKSSNFYILPKIHKSNEIKHKTKESRTFFIEINSPIDLKGRPIIAGCSSPTHRLSDLLDKLLSPIAKKVQTYVKDDWDFLHRLPNHLEYEKVTMYSVDITSLYTSINNDLGIEAISYWLNKHRHLIPDRFSNQFILKSLRFVLENNNFTFDDQYYKQEDGTAMGTKVAPAYACLTIAYLEESKLFTTTLRNVFAQDQCDWIVAHYKRYMDDGFVPLLNSINISDFMYCLNSLHPSIKFTFERASFKRIDGIHVQTLNFLDITVMLDSTNKLSTDIFYKPTNAHDYLNYKSDHPDHTKNNVPYNLAKRVNCFVSDPQQTKRRLKELKYLLLKRDYPEHIIDKAFHNALLQGPAPFSSNKSDTLPFVTTNFANFKVQNVVKQSQSLIEGIKDPDLKSKFKNTKIILSQRQPRNLLNQLCNAKFTSNIATNTAVITNCNDKRCNICKYYLQHTTEFTLSNGNLWEVKRNMSCNSKNVIYYLSCNQCNNSTTYIGKTNNLRLRTNQHISTCRTGRGSDKFDQHVFNCGNSAPVQPYFKLYLMLELKNEDALLTYEKHFHNKRYDTMNAPNFN